ncbi:MAG: META domain-containing protein [Flavobacteriaceae bacterium]|nr:META domain-containing protein [Flavobacteriaceae bacterium]
MNKYVVFIALMITIISCDATKSNGKATKVNMKELTGNFKITSLNGTDTSKDKLTFEMMTPGAISGSAGCNGYFGNISFEGEGMSISKVGSTKKLCPDSSVMKREKELLNTLPLAVKGEMQSSGEVHLKDSENNTLIVLQKETEKSI